MATPNRAATISTRQNVSGSPRVSDLKAMTPAVDQQIVAASTAATPMPPRSRSSSACTSVGWAAVCGTVSDTGELY